MCTTTKLCLDGYFWGVDTSLATKVISSARVKTKMSVKTSKGFLNANVAQMDQLSSLGITPELLGYEIYKYILESIWNILIVF